MVNYEILNLSTSQKWSYFLKLLPLIQQDIYFTPEYYKLYEENGDGVALCFVYKMGNDIAMYPFLKNSINNLKFNLENEYYDIQGAYGYNGVVTSSYNSAFIESFFKVFQSFCVENNIIAEFTRFHPLLNNVIFSHGYLDILFDRMTIFIDLQQDIDEITQYFQRTTKKQIKRAVSRYGITVETYTNVTGIVDFFLPIYKEVMDRVNSTEYLYFKKSYFSSLLQHTKNVCFVAYQNNKSVAVIICLLSDYFIHGHLGGATTESLSFSPYSLLYYEIIKYGKQNGYKFLHLGGGATSADNDSLFNFKCHFSNTKADFYIGKKIHNKTIYNQVVSQWEQKFPEKIEKYSNILLKYRY
jgi:hypothetical protein